MPFQKINFARIDVLRLLYEGTWPENYRVHGLWTARSVCSQSHRDLVIQQMCLHNGGGCTEESLTLCTCVQQRLEHSLWPIAAPVIDCICIDLFINGPPWPSNCQRPMIVQVGFIIVYVCEYASSRPLFH